MGIATFNFGLGLQQLTFFNTFESFGHQPASRKTDRLGAAGKDPAAFEAEWDGPPIDPASADPVARTAAHSGAPTNRRKPGLPAGR